MTTVNIFHRTVECRYLAAVLHFETSNIRLALRLARMQYPDRRRFAVKLEREACI